mgnify:CR=1 FL=1
MMEIKKFVELMTGEFDNKEQFMEMKEAGKSFPYAQHINTVCYVNHFFLFNSQNLYSILCNDFYVSISDKIRASTERFSLP